MLGYANNSSKGGSNSPLELPPLPQILSLEPITLGNQKHGCTGDIKRVFGLPLMNMSDGNSPGLSQPRHFHPAATEELKNIKESVESGLRKAKDRSNMFRESILKLEKFRDNLNSRKRQRSENVSGEKSGAELEKMGAQIRGNPRDAINQRQEQRPKSSVVVKRVRTSIGEARADSKVVTSSRQPSLLERNEERFQISKATLSRNIEKIHKVAGGGEVWEKKIKRKRSVTAVGNRLLNGDGEQKPLLPAKPSIDQKLRSCDSQTLRSKTYFGMNGTNRLGSRTESPGANSSTLLKNDPDIVYSPKDRMDMFESRVPLKGSSTNIQEGDVASSPGSSIKGKLSRIPRAGSGLAADPSPSSPSMHGGCAEDFELPLKANKISPLVIPGDKRHSLGSSSQPMAQWVGQRTHKKSRLRRANLVSPLLNPAEKSHNLSEDLGLLDYSARIANTGSDGSLHDYNSIKGYAKVKKELEKSPSPFGVLESDESGAWENGLRGDGVDGGEVSLTTSLNAGDFVLPGKKQKWTSHEHGGVRKHGRSGRGLSQSKIGIPPGREKMADSPGGNLPQCLYHGSDKGRSKSGRTSMGKSKDRSPMTRVGPLLSGSSYECTGEFDDDRETLVAAANSARNFSNLAFSGPFWPKIKRLFGSVNVDNESFSFLKQQHHPEEEFNESMFSGINNDILENVGLKEDSDHSGGLQRNQLYPDKDESRNSALSGKFNLGKLDKVTPLYERILSALIEDENEEIYHNGEGKISSLQCASDDSHCGSCNHIDGEFRDRMESEVESTVDVCNQKVGFLDKVFCDKSVTSCSLKSLSASMYSNDHSVVDDDYCHSDAGMVSETCSNDLGQMLKKESSNSACSYPDSQYEMMSLDERLMLELRSIDLYPDMLPDLSEGGETIHNNIAELRKDLRQKVDAKKDSFVKIEKALVNENVVEKRKLEETAMNKLMEMAYKKRMACRGGNLSKAAVRKVPKQVALAFIKRTLARYRKYKDTGISSFADPSLAEILFSPSMDAKSGDCVGSGTASNTLNDASNNQQELRGAGYSHGENAGEKPGSTLHKGRKKEMHIDDVGCTSSKMAALEGTATPIGPKGKRGERHKNLNSPLNGKAKLKQKTNNLHPTQRPVSRPESEVTLGSRGNDLQMDASDDPLDLARIGLDGGQEDLTTILDFDMDGEQDPEAAVGLEIPPWDDVGLEVPPWDDQFVFGL
ncbi:hypothetical protein MLD38_040214 [Melastoma candidum]|uniref:Uncharacterized protein n=1 Tax=Melastoma candidum TaxID=119954 RepID=A0ACB9L5B2_9MYRT|nr:hypothetical protein MLD38_040214 [Melastoma candidum]